MNRPKRGGRQDATVEKSLTDKDTKPKLNHFDILSNVKDRIEYKTPFVDTHCHWPLTMEAYMRKTNDFQRMDAYEFIRDVFGGKVSGIINIHCEAPLSSTWKEMADSSFWSEIGMSYGFACGLHPHHSKDWNDQLESSLLEAMKHPRCVAWGECGLDYHYDHSPRDVQREIFERQLKLAVSLGKPIVVHTREAEEDTEDIIKRCVPKDHKVHVHCFTDSPSFAARLLDHFPNLYIGVTGVVTYASNQNTSQVIRELTGLKRILLETDSPFMTPNNLKGKRPSVCHSAMIPWTAQFVSKILDVDTEEVLRVTRQNALDFYGI
ncbi:hypothetical protein PROFUN_06509 [Planoprotostelium fungivorum]|uniref:Uncharacterized protein n=1 Tax=Planoprotostelium fungivorum TaxID=1890364 RepID=A0A2P6NP01_9EUKA|nr:hypothetical protein PROFUN_06509 [Planoprotostelium fungivorum]